jgi:hypothetical protein
MSHDRPDEPRPARVPAPAAPPAVPAPASADESALAPAAPARTPDEYTEPPGSHRRPDGAATDVGA